MKVLCLVRVLAASAGVLLAAGVARGQVAPALARPPAWVLKGGLRLTHLSYSRSGTTWQMLLPASLGLEYRLNSRVSLYTQLDTDVQLRNAARARRRRAGAAWGATLPMAALGLGGRYYYGRPAGALSYLPAGPEFGKYLALEGGTDLTQQAASATRRTYAARGSAALLSPFLYARWGIQNRLRPHLLYDLNAGLGLVAPTRAAAEYLPTTRQLDVAAQVNISFYFAN